MNGTIHIGTSGWQYKHWIGTFYPDNLSQSKMLSEYVKHFDTVELNSSFYGLPSAERFEKWKAAVPAKFLYAVKANRFITHQKKLHQVEEPLERFLDAASALGNKLGPILYQLPPKWNYNAERFEHFLSILPKQPRAVFEFRNETWMSEEVFDLLRVHDCAFCIYELAGYRSPEIVTTDFAYVRLHGPEGRYRGSYSHVALEAWAKKLDTWAESLKHVFIYFDNDQSGYAPRNALALKTMIDNKKA